MKIPETNFKVKFGVHTIKVKYTDSLDYIEGWGMADYEKLTIFLKPHIEKTIIEETFVHELIHFCLKWTGLDIRLNRDKTTLSTPSSEEVTNELSCIFYWLIKDNPKIFC